MISCHTPDNNLLTLTNSEPHILHPTAIRFPLISAPPTSRIPFQWLFEHQKTAKNYSLGMTTNSYMYVFFSQWEPRSVFALSATKQLHCAPPFNRLQYHHQLWHDILFLFDRSLSPMGYSKSTICCCGITWTYPVLPHRLHHHSLVERLPQSL